ncbi:1-acyl dihydroxyacetone phosphate reductase [Microdochium trichocladiopsis]|uniref:1-acyl dihydroxyacetone phosphate reductase n=1 Tax=Microdochium trichocladiopsis TaxID=1682393 RepID=A0A9P9BIZ0_9PEZI|nr:1-acyl dihydroxyacetone phosphate reductase [Microdochium trichocladiopsis]KAH7014101.1 1-acyl dihydroxyacetone phosphate reductase [Microdochium trichocladiopsis]
MMPAHSNTKTVAVVTGCSSGIGQGLAEVLAARGLTVVATARKVESLAHLTKKHDNIIALPLELGDLHSLASFRDAVAKRTGGRVDILINNAGTHYAATAADLEIAEAEKLFTINVFAVMRLCQLFLPMLRESASEGRGGRIVQIGSVTRNVPVVWQSVYNASKAALSQYTNTLRLEVKPFGVSVTEVVTGYVQSNILHHGLVAPPDSLYLPIKADTERMKYEGNRTGMPARLYAESVVDKILRPKPSSEIWEGKLAWMLGFLVNFCPSWFSRWVFYRSFKLDKLKVSRR